MVDLKFAKVLYDYDGQNDEEMTASKGDMVLILDDTNNWWKVENQRGKIGILPSNYLQTKIIKKNSLAYHFYKLKGFNLTNREFTESENSAEIFVAKYNYAAKGKDEISFNRGELIEVTCRKSNDWWIGTVNGKIGKFPSNHVRQNIPTTLDNSNGYSNDFFNYTLKKTNETLHSKSITPKSLSSTVFDTERKISSTESRQSVVKKHVSVCKPSQIEYNYLRSEETLDTINEINTQNIATIKQSNRNLNWYHGNITRQIAENLLGQFNEPGRFLIRNSESKPNDLSLSVIGHDRIRHYKITCFGDVLKEDDDKAEDGASCSIGDHSFPKIGTLIEFYKRNALLKTAEFSLFLTKPLPCMFEN